MIVWLVDYDGKIENLALMRLSGYHKGQGDTVRLKFGHATPELFETPDRVYISCLFRWNRAHALALADVWGGRAVIGGTGVDIKKQLPPEVKSSPDYSLYGNDRAIGFISRGCIRRCPWCVVPEKEGKLHRVSTAAKIVRTRNEAIFLDNNFLALPDHHKDLEWLAKFQVGIDFNQANDARLITADNAKLLAECKWKANGSTVRISLDSVGTMPAVERALGHLKSAGMSLSRVFVFCLIGYSGLQSDVERLLFLRRFGVSVFPMGYRNLETGDEPANGWDLKLYKKYRRLICRMPRAASVWEDFERDVQL